MLKRISWVEDSVFSVHLRDDLYTLAQMRKNHIMQFFDVESRDGCWTTVDLNKVTSLFFAFVAENKLKSLLAGKIDAAKARPSAAAIPKAMLSAVISSGSYGANLVELTPDFSSVGGRILKEGLSPKHDLEAIHKHELVGMIGDPEKLRKRLVRYFDTGVNWDESKSFLFKDIKLPEPVRRF